MDNKTKAHISIDELPQLIYQEVNSWGGPISQATKANLDSTDQPHENMAKAEMGHHMKL